MSGGLIQLTSVGNQDVYLTGNPETTFWKAVYKKYTNFSLESIAQTFSGQVRPNNDVITTISRNGDLIHKCYLQVKSKDYTHSISDVLKSVELEIGGQLVDRHTGDFLDTWYNLSIPKNQKEGFRDMTCSHDEEDVDYKINGSVIIDEINVNSFFYINNYQYIINSYDSNSIYTYLITQSATVQFEVVYGDQNSIFISTNTSSPFYFHSQSNFEVISYNDGTSSCKYFTAQLNILTSPPHVHIYKLLDDGDVNSHVTFIRGIPHYTIIKGESTKPANYNSFGAQSILYNIDYDQSILIEIKTNSKIKYYNVNSNPFELDFQSTAIVDNYNIFTISDLTNSSYFKNILNRGEHLYVNSYNDNCFMYYYFTNSGTDYLQNCYEFTSILSENYRVYGNDTVYRNSYLVSYSFAANNSIHHIIQQNDSYYYLNSFSDNCAHLITLKYNCIELFTVYPRNYYSGNDNRIHHRYHSIDNFEDNCLMVTIFNDNYIYVQSLEGENIHYFTLENSTELSHEYQSIIPNWYNWNMMTESTEFKNNQRIRPDYNCGWDYYNWWFTHKIEGNSAHVIKNYTLFTAATDDHKHDIYTYNDFTFRIIPGHEGNDNFIGLYNSDKLEWKHGIGNTFTTLKMLPLYYQSLYERFNEYDVLVKPFYFQNNMNSYFNYTSVDDSNLTYYEIHKHYLPSMNSVVPFYDNQGRFLTQDHSYNLSSPFYLGENVYSVIDASSPQISFVKLISEHLETSSATSENYDLYLLQTNSVYNTNGISDFYITFAINRNSLINHTINALRINGYSLHEYIYIKYTESDNKLAFFNKGMHCFATYDFGVGDDVVYFIIQANESLSIKDVIQGYANNLQNFPLKIDQESGVGEYKEIRLLSSIIPTYISFNKFNNFNNFSNNIYSCTQINDRGIHGYKIYYDLNFNLYNLVFKINYYDAPYSSQFNPININKISSYNSFIEFTFEKQIDSILIQEDDIKIGDGFTQLINSDLLGALNSYTYYGEFISSSQYIKDSDEFDTSHSESFQSILPFFEHSTRNIITLNSFNSWNSTNYAPLLELTDFEFQTGQRAAFGVGRNQNGYNSDDIQLFEVYFDTDNSNYNSIVTIDSGLDGLVYYNNYESVLKSQSNNNHNSILIQRTGDHGETRQYYIKSGNSDNSAEMYKLTGGRRVDSKVSLFKANSSDFGPFTGNSIGQYSDMFDDNSFYNSDGVTEITDINDFSKDMIVLNSSDGNSSWYIVTFKDDSEITLSEIENSQPNSEFIEWEFGLNNFLNMNNSIVKLSEVELNSVIYKLDESHHYIINSIENDNKVYVLFLQNSEQYVNSWHYIVSGYKTNDNSFIYSSDAFQFIKDTRTHFITFNSSSSFMAIKLENNNSHEHFFQSMPFDDAYYDSINIPTGYNVVVSSQSNSVTRIYYTPLGETTKYTEIITDSDISIELDKYLYPQGEYTEHEFFPKPEDNPLQEVIQYAYEKILITDSTALYIDGDYTNYNALFNIYYLNPDSINFHYEKIEHHNKDLYIPLAFFFCQDAALSLPIIALQFHEVKLKFNFGEKIKNESAKLWVDYVYLDNDERKKMAQNQHEMLITQLQNRITFDKIIDLSSFSHPCKELIWTTQSPYDSAVIILNGSDRMVERNMKYYKLVQPFQHHTCLPEPEDNISVYSFAMEPENFVQPTGSCNFSRIDNIELRITGNPREVKIYALNWNVYKIKAGMGGLAYVN